MSLFKAFPFYLYSQYKDSKIKTLRQINRENSDEMRFFIIFAALILKNMKRIIGLLTLCFVALFAMAQTPENYPANYAKEPRFKALIYYSEHVEEAHLQFAHQAVEFFKKLNYGDGFYLDVTTDFSSYTSQELEKYDVLIMLNDSPHSEQSREAFEHYMENGGCWMGFHAAAYNDKSTGWPWFVQFLGGGVFLCNNWPPQSALLETETDQHDVTRSLPKEFVSAPSEFYQWSPSPRLNPDVQVLVSISQKNYPIGIKDVVNFGDFPIVWTNTRYNMIYLNMGHGDETFIDGTQNLLLTNAFRWVVSLSKNGNPFLK